MTDSQWISLREFARRCNRTHRAAQVAIASGRIPASAVRRSARGRIVAVEFREGSGAWRQNSAPRVNQPPVAIAGDLAGQGTDTYSAARTAREGANAKLAELEYLKTIGRVISQRSLAHHALMERLQQHVVFKVSADGEPALFILLIRLHIISPLICQHRYDHLRHVTKVGYLVRKIDPTCHIVRRGDALDLLVSS